MQLLVWLASLFRGRQRVSARAAGAEPAPQPAAPAADEPAPRPGDAEAGPAPPAGVPWPPRVAPVADPALRARTLESLQRLQQIPALQSLAQGFTRAMAQSDGDLDEVVQAVEKDPALCVRVLRMANSAAVAPELRIEDVPTAVQMLGLRRVGTLAHALFTMRDAQHVADGLDWRHLWVHSLATASLAEEIEQRLQLPPSPHLYLAALLHDVGKIVLSTVAPETYRGILAEVWREDGARLDDLELQRLGVGHREAGEMFARQCGLSAEVVAVAAHHADPGRAEEHRQSAAVVSLANYLAKAFGLGFSGARLEAGDGDFETQPGWAVLGECAGVRAEPALLVDELQGAIAALKSELRGLRDAA